jgi:hypothetical protein
MVEHAQAVACAYKGSTAVMTSYEVRCGRRLVSLQNAHTAREAVREYLRTMGWRESEITSVSMNALSCAGAVYRAIPLGSEEHLAARFLPD